MMAAMAATIRKVFLQPTAWFKGSPMDCARVMPKGGSQHHAHGGRPVLRRKGGCDNLGTLSHHATAADAGDHADHKAHLMAGDNGHRRRHHAAQHGAGDQDVLGLVFIAMIPPGIWVTR